MKKVMAITFVLLFICSTALAYIGNRNTRKFHRESCHSAYEIKASNRVQIATRDEAISNGYVPCKRCNP